MKNNFLSVLLTLIATTLLFSSCGGDGNQDTSSQTPADTTAQETPAPEYTLTPFSTSTEYQDAAMKSMDYKNGKFKYGVAGTNYKLGEQTPDAPQKMCANSKEGQHIHLIVDNEPYVAKYTAEFDQEIADGDHYVLSFLSRSYHESIKTKQAHLAKKVTVAAKSFSKSEDVKEPVLFYSRPKGNYAGKAETDKVMLDFYLVNTTLAADGNKVKVLVNNVKEFVVDTWQPYYIGGLPMGDNKIKLTLVDKDGNPVKAPLNPVERVFTLIADPAPGN